MHPRRFLITAIALTICLLGSASAALAGGDVIQVTVTSGRTFIGQVDEQTDAERLVLRSGSDRAWVRRPIAWRRITSAEHDGQTLTVDELKTAAERLKTAPVELPKSPRPTASAADVTLLQHPTEVVPLPPIVCAITFDAALANWDGDVEADGLLIALQPLDDWGQYTPASGTVEIELFARQSRVFHHAPLSGGRTVEPIARWTCAVTPADFGPSGAVLKFPFGASHPEFAGDLGSYGLVHVRFSVPGSGVFAHSQDGVRIRPFTPLRDTMQLNTGRRFLPSEMTGRGKTAFDSAHAHH